MPPTRAQRAFAEFVKKTRAGGGPSIEELCAHNRDIADELRRMHAEWVAHGVPHSFFDQLKTQVGDDVDPGISLDREPDHDIDHDTQALLQKISDMSRSQRYSIKGELARGGMGLIYKVWDRDLRRTLAMKVVLGKDGTGKDGSSAGVDRDRLGRFLEEAQITGQLDHPGIVPVHELGLDSEGRVYFTMRLVRGKEFREIIDEHRAGEQGWTLVRSLQVVQRICEAMAFAHEKGVVHRDLKPANVMVGRFGEVYVMDWGLAKIIGREDLRASESRQDLTQSLVIGTDLDGDNELDTMEGSVFGTPCYMAPEQARGQQDRIGPWSDVYAVGSILYHLLTGRMPYVPVGERMHPHAVLGLLLQGPPTPIRECDTSVPDELIAICGKAMERETENRYETMLDMAGDLQAFLEGRVVRAHKTGAVAEFTKWVRRNKGTAAAVACLIVVALTGAGGFAWQQSSLVGKIRARQQETLEAKLIAEANAREATRQSYVANLIAAEVSLRMNEILEAKRRLVACAPAARGWEWRHVSIKADSSVAVLPHENEVTCVAVDDNFFRIATGSADFSLRLFDTETNELAATLKGHTDAIVAVDFDDTGARLVSGSVDETVRVWDVVSRRNVLSLRGHEATVTTVDFEPGGTLIASGGSDNHVRIWDADTGRELKSIEAGEQPVRKLRFAPDGSRVAAGSDDGSVRVWSTDEWAEELVIQAHSSAVGALAFSPDGTRLATGSTDGGLSLWDAASGAPLLETEGANSVFCLDFAPNGEQLVVGTLDKSLRLVGTETGRVEAVLHGHDEPVRSVVFSSDGTRIVSGSTDGTARLWAAAIGGARTSLSIAEDEPIAAVAFAPDGRRMAASSLYTGTIRIWDAPSATLLVEIPGPDEGVTSLAFGPNGDWLAAGLEGTSTIEIYDTRTGEARSNALVGHDASVAAVAVSPDGTRIASASADQSVRLWSIDDGSAVELSGHEAPATSVAFSPDGRHIAAGATDGSLRTWNVDTGASELVIAAHAEAVRGVAYDPDGSRLVTASLDRQLRVFEASSGEPLGALSGHGRGVSALAFSPDGTRLVSASLDRTLIVWDLSSRETLLTLRGHEGPVVCVAFDPSGARVVSGGFDGSVTIWETTASSERYRSRLAAELVDRRLARLGTPTAVAESIRADGRLTPELAQEALSIASLRGGG